jgi:hypothetical protein
MLFQRQVIILLDVGLLDRSTNELWYSALQIYANWRFTPLDI